MNKESKKSLREATIIRNSDEVINKGTSGISITPSELHDFLMESGGSATYHEILFGFNLIDEPNFKVGCVLDSSLRGKVRKAMKGLSGKGVSKGSPCTYSLNGKSKFVCFKNGSAKVGDNAQSSTIISIEEVKK